MIEQENGVEVAQQLTIKLEETKVLLSAQDETEAVIENYKKVLETAEEHNLYRLIGEANFGIAQAYSHITYATNDLVYNQQLYAQRAYKAFLASEDQAGSAQVLAMLAELSLIFQKPNRANFYLRQLKRLLKVAPEAEWLVTFVEAQIFQHLDQGKKAEQAYKKCLSFGVDDDEVREKSCLRKLANLYHFSENKPDLARPLYEDLLDWDVRNNHYTDAVKDAHDLVLLYLNEHDLVTAQAYSQIAVENLEISQRNIASPTKQRELSKFGYLVRWSLVKILLRRGANRLAFENIELNRARSILKQFQVTPLWQQSPPLPEELKHYFFLQQRDYQRFEEIRDNNNSDNNIDNILIERWKDALWGRQLFLYQMEEAVIERTNLHTNFSATSGGRADIDESSILQELCSLLDPDTAVVTYFFEGARWFILLVTAQGLEIIDILTSSEHDAEHLCAKYRQEIIAVADVSVDFIASRPNLSELDIQLYSAFIAPVRPYIQQHKNIYLVPTRDLWSIPLHALGGRKRCMSETHQVAYIYSCSILIQILKRQRSEQKESKFLGIADPDGTLHGADVEVSQAAKLFNKAKILLGAEATKSNVLANIAEATVIHFACHGIFIDDYPEFSYLKLAQIVSGDKQAQTSIVRPFRYLIESDLADERLEVCTITQIPISAELVVLSACHTGQGLIYEGDEFVGFSSAFLAAGADMVLGSLWQIDNQATIEFMNYYYMALQHNSKAEAFQSAQRQLSQNPKYSHPYYWASFLMFGLLD